MNRALHRPALVTGGCGFIGRHLVAALLKRGERVRVLDTAEPLAWPADLQFVQGSILDERALARAMDGVGCVYHLAACAKLWLPDKGAFETVNAVGTRHVLRAAAAAGAERVVHCSTEAVLLTEASGRPTVVDGRALPPYAGMAGPYTRSKHRAEQAALEAAAAGQDVVVASPTVPIGPDDPNMTAPTAMLALFLKGGPPFFLDCVLNLVDVRDAANGLVLAGERGRRGERYVLGAENVPLRELLRTLEEVSGRRMPTRTVPPWLARASAFVGEFAADRVTKRSPVATREGVELALRSAPFDCRVAREALGYAPRPVRQALEDAVRWLLPRL